MEVSVSVSTIIILIVLFHTVLTHLFNWIYRSVWKEDGAVPLIGIVNTIELVLISVWIYELTN